MVSKTTPENGTFHSDKGTFHSDIIARLSVVERRAHDLGATFDERITSQKEATAIALTAADKGIAMALQAAERAAAKADLAASKEYLEAQISGLKETLIAQIVSQKEAINAALVSADKAVLKAEMASEKRFESVNEFRATLSDQQRDMATKSECDLRFKAMDERITESMKTRQAQSDALSARIYELAENMREQKGKSSGAAGLWGLIVGGIGATFGVVSILAIAFRLMK